MAKQNVTYTFENPNRDGVFEQILQQLLIEKLATQQREEHEKA